MPSIKDLYPDKWIHASDLPRAGETMTITRCTVENIYNTIDREYQPRLVLDFHEVETRAVLNKTQTFTVADITKTEEYGKWVGHQLLLVPGQARNKKPTILYKPSPNSRPSKATVATNMKPSAKATTDVEIPPDLAARLERERKT